MNDLPLREALDAIPDEVAILDAAGRITFTNRAWREFGDANGMVDSGCIGMDYVAVIQQAPDVQGIANAIRDVVVGHEQTLRWQYPCHAPDAQHWFEMRVGHLEGGGAAVTHTEVTDRVLREAASRRIWLEQQARTQAQATAEELQTLLNEVSHALATPLTPLSLQLAKARHANQAPDVAEPLEAMSTQVRRMKQALDAFASKLQTMKHLEQNESSASLDEIAAASRSEWHVQAVAKHVALRDVLPHVRVRVDPATLGFVLDALVREAMANTASDGEVSVDGRVDGDHVRLGVHHTGAPWKLTDRRTLEQALAQYQVVLHEDAQGVNLDLPLA